MAKGSMAAGHRVDWINIALIMGCTLLARAWPHQMLMGSFCVLGPAHYLTQMSWMADKRHFLAPGGARQSAFVGSCWAVALAVALLAAAGSREMGAVSAVGMAAAWGAAIMACLPEKAGGPTRAAAVAGLPIAVGCGLAWGPPWLAPPLLGVFAVAMPTLIHVFLFTAMFMLGGALRSKSAPGMGAVVLLAACAASFFELPLEQGAPSQLAGLSLFTPIAQMLSGLSGLSAEGAAAGVPSSVFGFLAFVYSYHYLNWFSKTEAIAWHRIPRRRMAILAGVYCAMLGSYALSMELGLALSVFAASLHIFLELPLDARAMAGLWRSGRG